MIGSQVGRYRLLEQLGQGSMGVVYKAHDPKLDRYIALKFLLYDHANDEKVYQRFIQEARATSALDHPNICTIHDIGEAEDGRKYIAMAYYEGGTLKQKLKGGQLSVEETLNIISQVADGLHRVHVKGIVHRDIKPANIFITDQGLVKILDFGVAKIRDIDLTQEGLIVGTASYMSPEQTRGEAVDHRTDIWSLGVMMYEMLTGSKPFTGSFWEAILYSILNEEVAPLSNHRKDLDADLEDAITKALAKNPDDRYSTIKEFREALGAIASRSGFDPVDELTVEGSFEPKEVPQFVDSGPQPTSARRWIPYVVSLLLIGVLAFWFSSRNDANHFVERDWLLITDVENLTGEELFDMSLDAALHVSIGQSKYVNVVPRQRLNNVLQRMKKSDVEHIDEQLGREIAEREGFPVLLVPSISKIGNTYGLSGMLQNAETGEMLSAETVNATGKDEVLDALDELCRRIRRTLGEESLRITRESTPLAQATTASLDALKQFALGREKLREGMFSEARAHYESAVEIDSTFTSAWASLGMLHWERSRLQSEFDSEKGKVYLERALQLIDNVTDEEKYTILAFHARAVEDDMQKAIDYQKVLVGLDPDNPTAHNNLGRALMTSKRYQEAAMAFKEAVRLDPYTEVFFNNLIQTYLYGEVQLDSALVWINKHLIYNPEHEGTYDNLGWTYLGLDSLKQAEVAYKKAIELNPWFAGHLIRLSHAYRLQGLDEEATKPMERVIEISELAGDHLAAHNQLGKLYRRLGQEQKALDHFEMSRQIGAGWVKDYPTYAYSYTALGVSLTQMGNLEEGWEIGKKTIEVDSTDHFSYAQLLSIQGRTEEALDQLELAISNGFTNYIWMKIHPDLESLYQEPRFQKLIEEALRPL